MAKRHQQGFTLMEALIAMAIFALIGALTYGVFARSITARERAEKITSRYHQIRQAMQRMATEISNAYITAHRDCEEMRTETVFIGERSGRGMRLDFASFSHYKMRADANESDQQELSYFVDAHPDDGSRTALLRRTQSRIDDEPQEGGVVQVLAEDVVDLQFEFYDPKEDRWEEEWDSRDDMDFKHRLPMFVAIRMKALNPAGEEELFVTKTRIFLTRELLITGTGFSRCMD